MGHITISVVLSALADRVCASRIGNFFLQVVSFEKYGIQEAINLSDCEDMAKYRQKKNIA